uniref:Guanylate cyclase n=1 Tax=Salmo trutta TaxID=8032 RepID=A0A673ZT48_SALTR
MTMATHRNSSFLINLSHHPRWTQDPSMRERRRQRRTEDTDTTPTSKSAVLRSRSCWGKWLMLPLLMATYLPCEAWGATFTVAVVGPWTCDPMYSKALPDLAARLATARLNKDPYTKKGYWYDYTLVNEDCKTSRALARFTSLEGYGSAFLGPTNPGYCSSAALFAKNWNKPLLSWGCLKPNMEDGQYPTFHRPLPLSSRVLFSMLRYFRWAHVVIVTSEDDLWEATGHELAASLRALGLPVSTVVTMEPDKDGPTKALKRIRELDLVIMCMHSALIGGVAQYQLLTSALNIRMIDRGYVFIPYDTLTYSLPKGTNFNALTNDSLLRKAYDAVLTITMDSGENTFYQSFKDAQEKFEIRTSTPPDQVSPFFGTIYNMIYYMAYAVEKSRLAAGRWVDGETMLESDGGVKFEGFNQHISSDKDGLGMLARYVVLDSDGGDKLYMTHTLEAPHTLGKFGAVKYNGRSIHFAGSSPSTDSRCWFSPYITCGGGRWSSVGVSDVPVAYGKISFGGLGEGEGPLKIVLNLNDLIFINTQTSIRGDWVWLKRCPNGNTVSSVSNSTKNIFTKLRDMRHENLNLFLGLFLDSGIFGIVTEHCTRGSLEDLLNNEEMRLDWMFKSSLLMDLVRGMKYLHNRNVIHGRLKSRNCVVDGRFVLKVTEYGFNEILSTQSINFDKGRPEDQLWVAPELLRNSKLMKRGTFRGDVYSFAIIMQEVIARCAPFCMLDMPPKEIISKLKSPPPLCRPTVSTDEAPLEVIQVMKQAWSEEPDKRPTFEEIFKQFKSITKGKKTNIIDSMLRMLEQYSTNLEDLIRERTEELEVERKKTDQLLAQMLPRSVCLALKTGKPVKPEHFSEVTLYFSDIVGFTTISALSEPIEVVDLLNDLYTLFDAIIGQHDVYKVETIGDAYMVASGVPNRNGRRHAAEMSNMSLDILHCIGTFKMRHMPDVKVKIRIGLHSGPVVAGVVGLTMPRYCLFGDTVNTASRMESTGLPYRIHVNQSTVDILHELKMGYKIDTRGMTELKGKGVENTFWLVGRAGFDKILPRPLEEIPPDRKQKFLDRQARNK